MSFVPYDEKFDQKVSAAARAIEREMESHGMHNRTDNQMRAVQYARLALLAAMAVEANVEQS
jgi:hypothetical protein